MQRVLLDLKADRRARRVPRASPTRADVVIESFRPGVVDRARHRLRRRARPSTPASSTARPAATARPARTRSGPATTSTTSPSAASSTAPAAAPTAGRRCPGATVADSAGGGMHAVIAILAALVRRGATGEGALPRRVGRRRRARADVALRRRVPRHRRRARARPRPPHRPLRLLRHLPRRRRQLARRSPPSSRASGPTCAGRSAASSGSRTRPTTPCRTQIRADFARRVRAPGPRRVGRASSGPADTCVAPVLHRARARRRRAVRAPAASFVDADAPDARRVPPGRPGARRAWTAAERRRRASATRPSPTPTTLLARRRAHRRRDRRAARAKEWSHDRRRRDAARRRRGADRRACSTRRPASSRSSAATSGRRCASVENGNPLFWDDDGRRRDHRRADRAADDAVGVVPPAPLGARAAPSRRLPLQVHFDLKERFELPEAVMTDNTIVFHEPVRPGDVLTHAPGPAVGERAEDDEARHRPLLGDRRRVPQPARRARRRRVVHRLRLPAGRVTARRRIAHARRRCTSATRCPALALRRHATTVVLGALASRDWRPMHHDHDFAVEPQRHRRTSS